MDRGGVSWKGERKFTLIISPLKSQSNVGKKVSKFLQIKTKKKEELKE